MANSPSHTPIQTADESESVRLDHWCYHCNKRVSVETVENLPDVICHECKNGFVEVIAIPSDADRHDDSSFTPQFESVLRILRQVAGDDDDDTPPPAQDPQSEDDFLGVELDGWYNDGDDEEENENDNEENEEGNNDGEDEDRSVDQNEENRNTGDDDEEDRWRIIREFPLRRRVRYYEFRRRYVRNQWTEILMGLGGNSIELRFELSDSDRYIGNPEDYVDAAGFEELLQNLTESDTGRRGAPPAAKSAVSGLPTVEILSKAEAVVCAICKDVVVVGEFMKKLPCGHGYHGDCIEPWLGLRNSCPVCRFELPTDDAEYEGEKKKRGLASVGGTSASAGDNPGSS